MEVREEKHAVLAAASPKPQPTSFDPLELKGFIQNLIVQTLQIVKPTEVAVHEHPIQVERPSIIPTPVQTGYLNQIPDTVTTVRNSREQVMATIAPKEQLLREEYLGKRMEIPAEQSYCPPEYLNDIPFLKILYDIQTRNLPASKKSNPFADFSMFAYGIANQVAQSTEIRSFLTKLHLGGQDTIRVAETRAVESEKPQNPGFNLLSKPKAQQTAARDPQTGLNGSFNRFKSLIDGLNPVRRHPQGDPGPSKDPLPVPQLGARISADSWHWAKRLPDMPRFVETNASVPSARSSAHLGPQK